ncbi:SIS domain-containing protein [bacterium]|nr:SIS domain-containing protein [bacterium]
MQSTVIRQLLESADLCRDIASALAADIAAAAAVMAAACAGSRTVYLCGNGGSAADCQHIAAELVGRYMKTRAAIPALALTVDTSILTAVGNDFGFEQIFSRQIEALGRAGDVLVGISTSGRSANVLHALRAAGRIGMKRVALTGSDPGPMAAEAEIVLAVPSPSTPRIQEAHAVIGHIICGLIEDTCSP